jgi:hypothetical protein
MSAKVRAALDIERTWLIECGRCSNSDNAYSDDAEQAREDFDRAGWRQGGDGFQMCPQCSGV